MVADKPLNREIMRGVEERVQGCGDTGECKGGIGGTGPHSQEEDWA